MVSLVIDKTVLYLVCKKALHTHYVKRRNEKNLIFSCRAFLVKWNRHIFSLNNDSLEVQGK